METETKLEVFISELRETFEISDEQEREDIVKDMWNALYI